MSLPGACLECDAPRYKPHDDLCSFSNLTDDARAAIIFAKVWPQVQALVVTELTGPEPEVKSKVRKLLAEQLMEGTA